VKWNCEFFELWQILAWQKKFGDRGTVASVVIQEIGSRTNEETLMKAAHPMIRLGQFGACTKLV